MIIRAQHTADAAVVRQLLTSAFKDAGRVADLAETLARRLDRPVPALVAEVDATLVGLVQLSRGWIDADRQLVEVLILSPLGVLPTHQHRGTGRALCDAAYRSDVVRRWNGPGHEMRNQRNRRANHLAAEGAPCRVARFEGAPPSRVRRLEA